MDKQGQSPWLGHCERLCCGAQFYHHSPTGSGPQQQDFIFSPTCRTNCQQGWCLPAGSPGLVDRCLPLMPSWSLTSVSTQSLGASSCSTEVGPLERPHCTLITSLKTLLQNRKMAQAGECLPCKDRDLSPTLRTCVRKLDKVVCALESETSRS